MSPIILSCQQILKKPSEVNAYGEDRSVTYCSPKRIRITGNKLYLIAENPEFDPIEITPEMGFEIWGVVTYVIHPVK